MNKILVVGVFDLFHRGHVELLRKASLIGGELIVIVNGDNFTEKYKRRPVFSEEDRLSIVKACKYVDLAIISNEADVKPYVELYGINTIVHGNDWEHSLYLKQICLSENYIKDNNIKLVYTDYYDKISTSGIISKIKKY